MKKTLFVIFVIGVALVLVFYIKNNSINSIGTNQGNRPFVTTSQKESFFYNNTKLKISFVTTIPMYDRSSGGYMTISSTDDPHFYTNKYCADNYTSDCFAFEIQKVNLPGQSKDFVISGLKNKSPITSVSNEEFDFYKQTDKNSPGWNVSYFVISKTSDLYYSILTNATSTALIETEILTSFKTL